MDPLFISEALAHSLSAYFLYINSLIHGHDPYSNLYSSPLYPGLTRDEDLISKDGRRVDQVAFRFKRDECHHPYLINTYIPACARVTNAEFRFHTMPYLMQRAMRYATLTRSLAMNRIQVYPVEWLISKHPVPMHRIYGLSECHIFTGYTGHRRTDSHAAESIMGYVFLEAFNESDIRIHIVFRGSQSGDMSRTARLLLSRSGNPDWLTNFNFDFVNFLQHRLPHGIDDEFEIWRQQTVADLYGSDRLDVPVHEGFRQSFFSCLPAIRQIFTDIACRYPTCRFDQIITTGHSLGGALAQLFWYATTLKDFIHFMTNGVVRTSIPARAIIFSSPHIWHSKFPPHSNGRVMTFEIFGDQVVDLSYKLSRVYPLFTKRVQLPLYRYENVHQMGWPQQIPHSHDPIALLESLRHHSTLMSGAVVLPFGEKIPWFIKSHEYVDAIRRVFPPMLWRGEETVNHYIHIFRAKDFEWIADISKLRVDERRFFDPYRKSLIFYGILEDMRAIIINSIMPQLLRDSDFSLRSITRRLIELLEMIHSGSSLFEVQNIKRFLMLHFKVFPHLKIIILKFLEMAEILVRWYATDYTESA